MKKLIRKSSLAIIALLIVFSTCSCDNGSALKSISANTSVTIKRSVSGQHDPVIKIAAEKATLDYEKRTITIENPISFGGSAGASSWVIKKMDFGKNSLVIHLDSDTPYHVYIGKQYHFLSAIDEKK